jgi:hypothetical protein
MGCVVGLLFTTAAVTVQKCAVLPLSAIAKALGGIIFGGGGPTKTVDRLKSESLLTLGGIEVVSRDVGVSVGSPRRQLLVVEAAAAVLLS